MESNATSTPNRTKFHYIWQLDGDINQVKATVHEVIRQQCVEELSIRCKQNASRIGVEQVADIIATFLILKLLGKTTNFEDLLNNVMENFLKKEF
eukprot:339404-Ditylum_brightwellii.AAC.1